MADHERALDFMQRTEERAAERVEPIQFGVALFHSDLPRVYDLNFVRITARGASAAAIAAETERLQAAAGLVHRAVRIDDGSEGDRVAAELVARGLQVQRFCVMAHRRAPDKPAQAAVEEVSAGALELAWSASFRERVPAAVVQQLVELKHVLARAVPTRHFAHFEGGRPVAFCDLYSEGKIGQIEAVETLPAFRRHGYARAVVLRALEESRAGGNDLTFLVSDADDWPQHLYAKLGFERIGRYWKFLRLPG